MENRMGQIHDLVESVDFFLVKSPIEHIDVDACIDYDFLLHVLELLKIKCSGILQCRFRNLKIRIKLAENEVDRLFFRLCI